MKRKEFLLSKREKRSVKVIKIIILKGNVEQEQRKSKKNCIFAAQKTLMSMKTNYIEQASEEVFTQRVAEEKGIRNREMNLAWQYISDTSLSVFLTGKAGTGKTTFLHKLKELTPKRMVVLAPTGVAAINAGGQTIHSFFQLPFGPHVPGMQTGERGSHYRMGQEKKRLIRTLDLLVIDEISMVRCDLLDAIDDEMRKYRDRNKPFGGVQLLLIGDLQQLAPVAQDKEWSLLSPYYDTPYFFSSKALQAIDYITVELKYIYRQQDDQFINLLAKIRENRMDRGVIDALNKRYHPQFLPPKEEDWIRLTTHNRMAQNYNESQLRELPASEIKFTAEVTDNFPETSYPADFELTLKTGAQVMFIKNDPTSEKAYYNGKIGVVQGTEWDEDNHRTLIQIYCKEDDSTIMLPPAVWENTKYVIDETTKEIREEVEGTFRQYPIRLAWAITVHKSQGLTFDHAVLDINASFTHGQVYVALSRCRTLEGIVLAHPLQINSIITDTSVNAFVNQEITQGELRAGELPQMKQAYFVDLLDEVFDFSILNSHFSYLTRVVDEHLYRIYPELLQQMKECQPRIESELLAVARKFRPQYRQLALQDISPSRNQQLQERLHAAFQYFHEQIIDLFGDLLHEFAISIGNKQVSSQYNNALDQFMLVFRIKLGLLKQFAANDEPFCVRTYLNAKAKAVLDDVEVKPTKRKTKRSKTKTESDAPVEQKPKKPDTRQVSFELYQSGKNVAEIADIRGLTSKTISSHLAYYVEKGMIDIHSLVPIDRQIRIAGIIQGFHGGYTLSDIKAKLPSSYSYDEIKYVAASLKAKER